MERHIKALKEVEQIYRLSQKWQRNMPDEKRPNFSRMADRAFRRALNMPVQEDRMSAPARCITSTTRADREDPQDGRLRPGRP